MDVDKVQEFYDAVMGDWCDSLEKSSRINSRTHVRRGDGAARIRRHKDNRHKDDITLTGSEVKEFIRRFQPSSRK